MKIGVYDDRAWSMDGKPKPPVLATVDWTIQFPHRFSSVEAPTKETPFPARALRRQRQIIGLIAVAQE